jgi:hypothetical protein
MDTPIKDLLLSLEDHNIYKILELNPLFLYKICYFLSLELQLKKENS